MAEQQEKLLMYKGRPLVRSGDTLYYGDMAEKYVIMMQVQSKKALGDLELSDKITVHLMLTDPTVSLSKRFIKKSEKEGLYNALDIGSIWLERALTSGVKKS